VVVTVTSILLFYRNVTGADSLGKETVNVCERTEILGNINNVQLQVIEYLDNCREQKYTGLPDKTINLIKIKHLTVISNNIFYLVGYY
jgi:hypothetical protein